MADAGKARRDAERTAEEALRGTLISAAGELGVARAGQLDAAEKVQRAVSKAAAVMAAAQAKADAIIAAADPDVTAADQTYATAWQHAKDAGWAPAQLTDMGYEPPTTTRRPTNKTTVEPAAVGRPPAAAVA